MISQLVLRRRLYPLSKSIIDKFAGPSASLKDVRVACICSLGYAGFFRYDELSNIAPEHLGFFS